MACNKDCLNCKLPECKYEEKPKKNRKDQVRAWQLANKEHEKERLARWYQEHKEEHKAKVMARYWEKKRKAAHEQL